MQGEIEKKKQMILSFVQDKDYRPIKIKEMAILFGVPKKQRGEFHEVLDCLFSSGKIVLDRRGRICLPEENILVGDFMATQRGFGFVRVEGENDDIFIPERSCQNAGVHA